MSHVSVVKTTIRSLDILAQAARDCGMQLNLGQKEFKAYYRGEGGGCEHAIVCPDLPQAYSIGVVQAGDGWELKFDSFCGGGGLNNRCGDGAGRLLQRYSYHQAQARAEELGWEVQEETEADGTIKLYCTPQAQAAWAQQGW